jgi:fructoselysine-6-P-deglycase FrlB-like protein
LCVAVVAIVRLGREPTIEVVTIAKEKSSRLVGTFEYAVAYGALREKPRALEANF